MYVGGRSAATNPNLHWRAEETREPTRLRKGGWMRRKTRMVTMVRMRWKMVTVMMRGDEDEQ